MEFLPLTASIEHWSRHQKEAEAKKAIAEPRMAMTWMQHLKRVINIDIEKCERCGGHVKGASGSDDTVPTLNRHCDWITNDLLWQRGRSNCTFWMFLSRKSLKNQRWWLCNRHEKAGFWRHKVNGAVHTPISYDRSSPKSGFVLPIPHHVTHPT